MFSRRVAVFTSLACTIFAVGCIDPISYIKARVVTPDETPIEGVVVKCHPPSHEFVNDFPATDENGCTADSIVGHKMICEFTKDGFQSAELVAKYGFAQWVHYKHYVVTLRPEGDADPSEVVKTHKSKVPCPNMKTQRSPSDAPAPVR